MNSRSTSPLSGQSRSCSMDTWVTAASAASPPFPHRSRGVNRAVRASSTGGRGREHAGAGRDGDRDGVFGLVGSAGEGASVGAWLAEMGAPESHVAFSAVENEVARRYQVRQGVSGVFIDALRAASVEERRGDRWSFRGTLPRFAGRRACARHAACCCRAAAGLGHSQRSSRSTLSLAECSLAVLPYRVCRQARRRGRGRARHAGNWRCIAAQGLWHTDPLSALRSPRALGHPADQRIENMRRRRDLRSRSSRVSTGVPLWGGLPWKPKLLKRPGDTRDEQYERVQFARDDVSDSDAMSDACFSLLSYEETAV